MTYTCTNSTTKQLLHIDMTVLGHINKYIYLYNDRGSTHVWVQLFKDDAPCALRRWDEQKSHGPLNSTEHILGPWGLMVRMTRENVKDKEEESVIIIIWLDSNLTALTWLDYLFNYKFYAAK